MNTTNILIFGLGVLGGYLLFKYSVQPAGKDIDATATAGLEEDCNRRWMDIASRLKAPADVIARQKAEFMAECLTGKMTSFEVSNDLPPAEMPPPQRVTDEMI